MLVCETIFGNPYDAEFWKTRAPERLVGDITAPTLLVNTWQDEQTGGGPAKLLERFADNTPARLLGANGDHGEYYRGDVWDEIVEFLDVYLGDTYRRRLLPTRARTRSRSCSSSTGTTLVRGPASTYRASKPQATGSACRSAMTSLLARPMRKGPAARSLTTLRLSGTRKAAGSCPARTSGCHRCRTV